MHTILLAVLLACNTPEHRAFDFWVGEWRVEANGKLAGHSTITKSYDGCVLEERWRGAGGMSGVSLNIYDAATKKWHQSWADSRGTLALFDGGIVDGAMRMGNEKSRMTWTPIEGGRVRQVWEQTTDGKTWTVVFDGIYIPATTTVRK